MAEDEDQLERGSGRQEIGELFVAHAELSAVSVISAEKGRIEATDAQTDAFRQPEAVLPPKSSVELDELRRAQLVREREEAGKPLP